MDFNSNPFQPHSPPLQQFEAYAAVSPQASMGSEGRRSTHSTPKRRRLVSSDQLNHDQVPTYAVPDDAFSSWPSVDEYHEYRHRQPHPPPPHLQSFDPQWEVFGSSWADIPEPFHPSFMTAPHPGPRQPPPLPERMTGRPQTGMPQHIRYAHPPPPPPPYRQEPYLRIEPLRSDMTADFPPTPLSHRAFHPHVSFQPASHAPFRKGAIILTLSRATEKSIEEIAEHKRECPACQLDFEPDNVLAIVECCNTAMHAVCFSAWVNSNNGPAKSRTKSCMKCRKAIDATDKMNSILPPVTAGNSWDQASDFNAPAQITVENPLKFDVSTGPHPGVRRPYRRDPRYLRQPPVHIPESEVYEEYLTDFRNLHRSHSQERERLSRTVEAAHRAWASALDLEGRAAAAASEARVIVETGGRMTQRELDGLLRRAREAKEVQEENHEAWRTLQVQLRRLDARQNEVQVEFVKRMRERRAAERSAPGDADSEEVTVQEQHEEANED